MYLARKTIEKDTYYSIRESFQDDGCWKSREIFDLGKDPSEFIVYPGGKGYYYDPAIEDALDEEGVPFELDEMDRIFWDFLDPEIQRVIVGFQKNWTRQSPARGTSEPAAGVHIFDKRRIHFLRCGQMDQRHLNRVQPRFFRGVWRRSRDEIEQLLTEQEHILKPRERAAYVYTVFNLQDFFSGPLYRQHPSVIEKETLDDYFIETLCALNENAELWAGLPDSNGLREYLIKYVIMYFDNDFPRPTFMEDYNRDFMNRHRRYIPPKKVQIKIEEAARLFGKSWKTLKKMDRKALTRLYRQKAMEHHPDVGGDQKTFVKLTDYFQVLLSKL